MLPCPLRRHGVLSPETRRVGAPLSEPHTGLYSYSWCSLCFDFSFLSSLPSLMQNNKHDGAQLFTYSDILDSDMDISGIISWVFTFNSSSPFPILSLCPLSSLSAPPSSSFLPLSYHSSCVSSPFTPLLTLLLPSLSLPGRWIEYVSYWMWMNKASHLKHTLVTPY